MDVNVKKFLLLDYEMNKKWGAFGGKQLLDNS